MHQQRGKLQNQRPRADKSPSTACQEKVHRDAHVPQQRVRSTHRRGRSPAYDSRGGVRKESQATSWARTTCTRGTWHAPRSDATQQCQAGGQHGRMPRPRARGYNTGVLYLQGNYSQPPPAFPRRRTTQGARQARGGGRRPLTRATRLEPRTRLRPQTPTPLLAATTASSKIGAPSARGTARLKNRGTKKNSPRKNLKIKIFTLLILYIS